MILELINELVLSNTIGDPIGRDELDAAELALGLTLRAVRIEELKDRLFDLNFELVKKLTKAFEVDDRWVAAFERENSVRARFVELGAQDASVIGHKGGERFGDQSGQIEIDQLLLAKQQTLGVGAKGRFT